jgi:acyl carrier protein
MSNPLTGEQVDEIRTALKRCSSETVEAVLKFRQEGNLSVVPAIIHGMIERYLPPESADKLSAATPETRLMEDLGIDSLTMLEMVLLIEETMAIHIEDAEMRTIRTMGDITRYLDIKSRELKSAA